MRSSPLGCHCGDAAPSDRCRSGDVTALTDSCAGVWLGHGGGGTGNHADLGH